MNIQYLAYLHQNLALLQLLYLPKPRTITITIPTKTSQYYNYYTHYCTHSPGFVNMVPIVVYSQVLHEGIPMIAQPARDKKNLHKLFAGALTFACES